MSNEVQFRHKGTDDDIMAIATNKASDVAKKSWSFNYAPHIKKHSQ